MIEVTKLNGETIMVNADHIETVEAHPDTTLVLNNDKRIVIRDSVAEVVRKVIEYQRSIRTGPRAGAGPRGPDEGTV
jgi:flagellar protein FlbD